MHKWLHYFDIYHRYFHRYRGRPITFVEIGVQHGGSLPMWQEYFGPKARIVGVDIDQRCRALAEDGFEVFIGDQADAGFLSSLVDELGSIDILLDDGGHRMSQQKLSFHNLYPAVAEDGLYVVEDTHTSYWRSHEGGLRRENTFIEFAKELTDQLHAWHGEKDSGLVVDGFTTSTMAIHFYDSMVVFEKGRHERPLALAIGDPSF